MKSALVVSMVLAGAAFRASCAQTVIGDWEVTLNVEGGQLHLVLHIAQTRSGGLQGSMDSIDQPGGNGVAMTSVVFANGKLAFTCTSILATFEGRLTLDGSAICEGVDARHERALSRGSEPERSGREGGRGFRLHGARKGNLRLGMRRALALVVMNYRARGPHGSQMD